MGLDQYAGSREPMESKFVWRKHAKLQAYMEDLWYSRHKDEINCEELVLDKEDIIDLKEKLEKDEMPESEGGFFYGHEFQDESAKEYKEQDLEFCNWALNEIEQGRQVVYTCWY